MRERPINLKAWEVNAILEGRKTMLRRIVKLNEAGRVKLPGKPTNWHLDDPECVQACPLGKPGDQLWGREAFLARYEEKLLYRADGEQIKYRHWQPSSHMPRWASRILLEMTDVRVERLNQISEDDAIAEGIEPGEDFFNCPTWKCYGEYAGTVAPDDPVGSYKTLWESIHGPGSWDANPFVWAVSFRRIEQEARAA